MDDDEIEIDNFDDDEEYGPIGLKPQVKNR